MSASFEWHGSRRIRVLFTEIDFGAAQSPKTGSEIPPSVRTSYHIELGTEQQPRLLSGEGVDGQAKGCEKDRR